MMRTIPYILLNGDDVKEESLFRKTVDLATLQLKKEHLERARQRACDDQMELAILPGIIANRILTHLRVEIKNEFSYIGDALVGWMDSLLGTNGLSSENVIDIIGRLMKRDAAVLRAFTDWESQREAAPVVFDIQ